MNTLALGATLLISRVRPGRAGSRRWKKEVLVEELRNLAPGTRVAVSGTYRCEFCGSGGWADTIAKEYKKTQRITLDDMEQRARQSNTLSVKAGDRLPECPHCGPGTLWTLVQSDEVNDE